MGGNLPSSNSIFKIQKIVIIIMNARYRGRYTVAQLVEALCYKPEGCPFDS